MRAPALLLQAGAFQALLGLVMAVPAGGHPYRERPFHAAVMLATGLALLALALALSLAPAFTRRETGGTKLAWGVLLGVLGADLLALILRDDRLMALPLLPAALLVLARGPPLPEDPRAPRHLVGDRLALAALALSWAGVAAGAALLLAAPRGLPVAGIVVLVASALAGAAGGLLFLLPRLSDAPLKGALLHGAALAVLALATFSLALSFSLPRLGGFRAAAGGVLLAHLLALVGFLRARLPEGAGAAAGAARARPLLRGAAVLGPLAGVALLLALLADAPNELLPLAAYAHLALAALLLGGALALAAPFLGRAPAGGAGWGKAGAALLIAGLFLLAPSYQYAYSPFLGALVLALGGAAVVAPWLVKAEARRRRSRGR